MAIEDKTRAEEPDPYEDAKSELSKSDSLNMKLAPVKGQISLTPQQKLELLNQSLTLKDWKVQYSKGEVRRHAEGFKGETLATSHAELWFLCFGPYLVRCVADFDPHSPEHTSHTEDVSWTNVTKDWTEEEITANLSSCRFSQRAGPDTPGVWEYKDNNKVKVTKTLKRSKEMTRKTKEQLKPEEKRKTDEEWPLAWQAFQSTNSFNDIHLFGSGKGSWALGKRNGKGEGKEGLKGKGE